MHTICTSSFPLIEAAICNIALGLKRSKQDDIGLIKKWMTGKLLLLHAFGVELLSLWSLSSCFAQDSEQSSHVWVFLPQDSNKCYPWFLNATEYLAILRSEFCNWIEKIIIHISNAEYWHTHRVNLEGNTFFKFPNLSNTSVWSFPIDLQGCVSATILVELNTLNMLHWTLLIIVFRRAVR